MILGRGVRRLIRDVLLLNVLGRRMKVISNTRAHSNKFFTTLCEH